MQGDALGTDALSWSCQPSSHASPDPHAPLRSLADSLFQQCYKPNARLLAPQGEELQRVRAAANRHTALVLDVRCGARLWLAG